MLFPKKSPHSTGGGGPSPAEPAVASATLTRRVAKSPHNWPVPASPLTELVNLRSKCQSRQHGLAAGPLRHSSLRPHRQLTRLPSPAATPGARATFPPKCEAVPFFIFRTTSKLQRAQHPPVVAATSGRRPVLGQDRAAVTQLHQRREPLFPPLRSRGFHRTIRLSPIQRMDHRVEACTRGTRHRRRGDQFHSLPRFHYNGAEWRRFRVSSTHSASRPRKRAGGPVPAKIRPLPERLVEQLCSSHYHVATATPAATDDGADGVASRGNTKPTVGVGNICQQATRFASALRSLKSSLERPKLRDATRHEVDCFQSSPKRTPRSSIFSSLPDTAATRLGE